MSLAERMFHKLIVEDKIDAEQEVQLYLMILDRLEKYEDILIILDGPLGTKLQCSNIPQNRLQYLKKLKYWDDVNLTCKGILIERYFCFIFITHVFFVKLFLNYLMFFSL